MVIARGMDRGRGCYKGLEGVLGVGGMERFYILIGMAVTQMYVFVKTQNCTLKRVNFTV